MKRKLLSKTIVILLALMLCFSQGTFAFADTVPESADNPSQTEEAQAAPEEVKTEKPVVQEEVKNETPAPKEEPPAAQEPQEPAAPEPKQDTGTVNTENNESIDSIVIEETNIETATEKEAVETTEITQEVEESAPAAQVQTETQPISVKAKSRNSNSSSFDNSTTLKDGTYEGDQIEGFEFKKADGGTSKATFTLEKVTVSGGKATAVIKTSSAKMTHMYLGTVDSEDENTSLYDPETGDVGGNVYVFSDKTVTVPAKINEKTSVAVRTTAMTDPKWVQYEYTITISESSEGEVSEEPNSYAVTITEPLTGRYAAKEDTPAYFAKQPDGTYVAKITLKYGSTDMAAIGSKEDVEAHKVNWYKSEGDTNNAVYVVPVDSMDSSVDIMFHVTSTDKWTNTYTFKFSSEGKTESEEIVELGPNVLKPEESGSGSDPTDPAEPSDPTPTVPTTTQTLADGTYKVLSTTDRKMFYLYPKDTDPAYSILKVENGKMTATITLSGTGYDYVYMGTPDQAVNAGESAWSKATVVNGYYTYTVPVSALDTKLAITPRSHSYYIEGRSDAWRPDKWIIFYSGNAIKIADGTSSTAENATQKNSSDGTYATSGKQTSFKNDNKKDKVSKWSDDSGKSTRVVNSSTTLPDGVYTPDSFSWSGGSGRLAYIRCDKITVTNGKAYATIVFGSSSYDQLKANGRIYYKNGGGNSTFVIPVNLNANNTIIGRTTAMSQPHWVKYSIYIGKAENAADAAKIKEAKKEAAEAKMTMAEKAPEIAGLKAAEENDIQYAKYFKLFNYENGVKLLSVDISTDSALKEEYSENAKKAMKVSEDKDNIEYDDEGNIVAKSSTEAVEELYHYNVVNYLLVPEDYEVPAGLDKEYIIVRVPAKNVFAASEEAINFMDSLGHMEDMALAGIDEDKITNENLKKAIKDEEILISGNTDKPDYAKILKSEAELSILPGSLIPEAIDEEAENKEELEQKASEMKEQLETLESRFTALGIPVLIDRSAQEEDELAQAEWVKVYGALFGCEEEAGKIFDEQVKEAGK